jgi:hypothetical protein
MRIWSVHPKYLDAKGLVALWREALLARNVLEGKTIGYKHHPQLTRFKQAKRPLDAINQYLSEIYSESVRRNYNFDKLKVNWSFRKNKLPVTTGQVKFEVAHLLIKLKRRDLKKYKELNSGSTFEVNPLFVQVDGDTEVWEILPPSMMKDPGSGPAPGPPNL